MRTYLILIASLLILSCQSKKYDDLPVVKQVDLKRYIGTWFEIARKPNYFEQGLSCITATYTLKENGKIDVLNKGFNGTKFKIASGTAKIPDSNFPAKLKVSFFGPFYGDYQIIELDTNYKYALVGEPSREYLWILSRTAQLDSTICNKLIKKARSLAYKTDDLIYVDNTCQNP
jgi:lipocalin